MKFVLRFWCDVWVCEIDVKWFIDDEITCSKHAHDYTLHFSLKMGVVVVVVDGSCEIMWTVAVVVVRCYHWWFEPWVIIIIENY